MRRSPQPLVLLLDLGLPRLDGAEPRAPHGWRCPAGATRQRRRIRHADVPVTARSETAVPDLSRLLVAQQIPVVHAPFNSAHLLAIAAQAANRLPAPAPDQRLRGT